MRPSFPSPQHAIHHLLKPSHTVSGFLQFMLSVSRKLCCDSLSVLPGVCLGRRWCKRLHGISDAMQELQLRNVTDILLGCEHIRVDGNQYCNGLVMHGYICERTRLVVANLSKPWHLRACPVSSTNPGTGRDHALRNANRHVFSANGTEFKAERIWYVGGQVSRHEFDLAIAPRSLAKIEKQLVGSRHATSRQVDLPRAGESRTLHP